MNFESYKQLMLCEKDKDVVLRKGKSFTFDFDIEDEKAADRIFMTGEVGIFYNWKTEPDYQYLYRRIDDSLSSDEANKARFALDMSADNYDFPKIAYFKKVWWPRFYGGGSLWRTGISAKAENLKIHEGGYLHLLVEIRYKKDGVDKHIAHTAPDLKTVIDIPEGSYDWSDFKAEFPRVTAPIANVCVYVEGIHYSGKVFFENPYFASEDNVSMIHDFIPFIQDKSEFNWLGVNLSKVELPCFNIKLNGIVIHDGEIFERCHRYSEWEFEIPDGVAIKGQNTLEITHTSDYRDTAPYNIHELGLISVRRDMLISCPEVITSGKTFHVLVKTNCDNVEFTLADAPEYLRAENLVCDKAGLCVLDLICDKITNNIDFTLKHNEGEIKCHIDRCVERGEDKVTTGTGDMVYINQNKRDFDNYLSWYFSNNIGNLLTIRPTYRWSGSRSAKGKLWREAADLLNKLEVKSVHMIDGRELPGCSSNPTYEEMDSPNFLGRQNHELDGANVYWGVRDFTYEHNEHMFYDLFIREFLRDRERTNVRYTPETYVAKNGRITLYRDTFVKRDMESIANSVVEALNKTRYGSERHTGPATLFKYFYQAGYSWTGAELMYATTEPTCASLRGAAKVYGGNIGGHLATQWSSTPHDTVEHAKRYRLALYTSYMQGLNEINTEEGLWRMEEYFAYHNRYSVACLSHLREHQDFYRYVATHTRCGKFYTPVAFLSGRYDGWKLFAGKNSLWGRTDVQYGDAENAWDMIDVFYPKFIHGAIYRHPCPKDKPVGYYSGTPMGNIDILPIEAADYSDYPLLCAIGYNKAFSEDMDKLEKYVSCGGKLFLGLAQLTVTTLIADIEKYNLNYIQHSFVDSIAPEIAFVEDSVDGKTIRVNAKLPKGATVIKQTDGGNALIYELSMGDGKVYLLNTLEYAGNPAIYTKVKEFIAEMSETCFSKEKIWARGDDIVQFAVYAQENGDRHIYFLSTDWYNADMPTHTAKLIIDENEYDVNISYGTMLKAVVSGRVGAWFDNEDCDVLEISDGRIRVQGSGKGLLNIANEGVSRKIKVDFTDSSVKSIKI